MSAVKWSFWLCLAGIVSVCPAADKPRGIAVVELFTSEGCSSCPPADEVFADLARRSAAGEPIYCIGFHVDYWDKHGWKDEFSDNAYTQRQLGYMHKLKVDDVYTPQTIINGTRQFVGSRKKEVNAAVEAALQTPAPNRLSLTHELDPKTRTLKLKYAATADTRSLFLNLAVTQKQDENAVTEGENKDRTLRHAAIVRCFQVVSETDEVSGGTWEVTLPEDLPASDATAIAYLQHRTTFRIIAAAAVPLTKAKQ